MDSSEGKQASQIDSYEHNIIVSRDHLPSRPWPDCGSSQFSPRHVPSTDLHTRALPIIAGLDAILVHLTRSLQTICTVQSGFLKSLVAFTPVEPEESLKPQLTELVDQLPTLT